MDTLLRREPDFNQFLKVLKRNGKPDYLPFFELFASSMFIARRTGTHFDRMDYYDPGYWRIYVDFWLGMGFDNIPIEICPNFILGEGQAGQSQGSDTRALIRNMEDFETYPWPDESSPLDFGHYETVAALIPDGVKMIAGVGAGPYEWVSFLMGITGLSYALMDDPELVGLMFDKMRKIHTGVVRQLAEMDEVGAIRQGDDLGFKTATFLPPNTLRKYVFPIYKEMAQIAHDYGKPFILHSCGNLTEVYEDLIEYCKIDAKHSFEDTIMPVAEFKKQYGNRITPIGGLDVDVICRSSIDEVKAYTRKNIEECFYDGYWALGTGNSLANYMPVENYIAVLEEGVKIKL